MLPDPITSPQASLAVTVVVLLVAGTALAWALDERKPMSDQPKVSTSEPIYKAALTVGTIVAGILSVVGYAVQLGVVSANDAATITEIGAQVTTALPELAGAVTVIVGVVSGVGASVLTAWQARKAVVPTDSDAYRITPVSDVTVVDTPGEHRRDG